MNKSIKKILKTFNDNSYEAYIIGGYVRDKILSNEESFDVDITTNAKPKDIVKLFPNYNIKLYEYGNVSFEKDGYKFDITTFRKDLSYYKNRKPDKIVYVNSLEEDIKRRDFTMNTICIDKDNNIIDYYDGIKDLKNKTIKSIGNPNEKLKEDALRILRAVRFATRYDFDLDEELEKAIIKNKNLLKKLSYERKKEELNKLFSDKNKEYGINLLKRLDLIKPLELKNIDSVLLTNDLIGIWSIITDKDYAFTKKEKDIIKKVKALFKEDINDPFVKYKYGLYPLSIVCDLKCLDKDKILKEYDNLPIKDRIEIKITIDEICETLNKKPGKFIKDILIDIEKSILLKQLKNDKNELLEYILKKYK